MSQHGPRICYQKLLKLGQPFSTVVLLWWPQVLTAEERQEPFSDSCASLSFVSSKSCATFSPCLCLVLWCFCQYLCLLSLWSSWSAVLVSVVERTSCAARECVSFTSSRCVQNEKRRVLKEERLLSQIQKLLYLERVPACLRKLPQEGSTSLKTTEEGTPEPSLLCAVHSYRGQRGKEKEE